MNKVNNDKLIKVRNLFLSGLYIAFGLLMSIGLLWIAFWLFIIYIPFMLIRWFFNDKSLFGMISSYYNGAIDLAKEMMNEIYRKIEYM